jgi:hypothetical protein
MTSSVTITPRDGAAYVATGRSTCLIGRGSACDIRPAGPQVSRHHCLLDVNPPRVRIRDLGSRNGTYVNGERLQDSSERDLVDGDEIWCGGAVLHVSIAGTAADEATVGAVDGPPDDGRDSAAAVRKLLAAAEAGEPSLVELRGHRLLGELGRGGQGVVHLARYEPTGELRAVKILVADGVLDAASRAGFLREFACTRALRHRNILAMYGAGVHGDTFCFTGEFCRLGSVTDLVARSGGGLAVEQALELTLQALRGLAYAHTAPVPVRLADGTTAEHRGLVHRDLKPQNLLLTGAPDAVTLKIADFGLAKAFDSAGLSGHTLTGAMGGSLAFMPRGQVIDFKYARPEVDLWAVMACLYWMLTGCAPRDFPPGADPVAVVLREPPIPIRDRRPTLPRRLAGLIDAMLVDQPGITPTTPDGLASALRRTQ